MTPTPDAPGLYIHIPFCTSRCSYCTFYSSIYDEPAASSYLEALRAEIDARHPFSPSLPPATVFIGGGTPTSLSLEQLETLLDLVPELSAETEFSCEMNPESVTEEKLRLLRERGVTRCSFGVQTFQADGLRLLGRKHDADTARRTVAMAVDLGFASVNIDIIHGWPGQKAFTLLDDLKIAVALGVRHVSCYSLILEPESVLGTFMDKNRIAEADEACLRDLWDATEEFLESAGFEHYETSNYACPGFRCRHNVDTWKGKDYVGIGAAAHSHAGGRRFANISNREEYSRRLSLGKSVESFSEQLGKIEKARECAVFWLRLFDGVDLAEFHIRNDIEFMDLYKKTAEDLIARSWLRISADGARIFVPRELHPTLDSVLVELI
jgi:oxygen-independent coproporphyrinogen-3 oxidase